MKDRDAELAEQVAMWDQANALLDSLVDSLPVTDRADDREENGRG